MGFVFSESVKNEQLEQSLSEAAQESSLKKLEDAKLHRKYEDALVLLDRIPKKVLDVYVRGGHGRKERFRFPACSA